MKFKNIKATAGLCLLSTVGVAGAQDLGNGVAATEHLVSNLDSVLQSVALGDVTAATEGTGALVSDLIVDFSDGTPLAQFTPTAVDGIGQLTTTLTSSVTPALGGGGEALAGAFAPVVGLYFPSQVLAGGLPFVDGETINPFEQVIGLTSGLPLEATNMLFRIDLFGPGDGDGGGVLIPIFGGDGSGGLPFGDGGSSLPIFGGGELVGDGIPFLGGANELLLLGSLPIPGSSGGQGLPVIGALLSGSGFVLAPVGGSVPDLGGTGIPLNAFDTATLTALLSGASLAGLP